MQLPTPFRDKSKLLPRLSRPQYPTAPHQQPRTPFGSPQGAAAAAAVTVAVAVAVAQRHSRISTWSLDGRFGHRRELILFDNPYLCKTNCHWCANDQNSWQLQVGTWKLEGRCYCCWKFAVRSLCAHSALQSFLCRLLLWNFRIIALFHRTGTGTGTAVASHCCGLLWPIPCRFEELCYVALGCVTRDALCSV